MTLMIHCRRERERETISILLNFLFISLKTSMTENGFSRVRWYFINNQSFDVSWVTHGINRVGLLILRFSSILVHSFYTENIRNHRSPFNDQKRRGDVNTQLNRWLLSKIFFLWLFASNILLVEFIRQTNGNTTREREREKLFFHANKRLNWLNYVSSFLFNWRTWFFTSSNDIIDQLDYIYSYFFCDADLYFLDELVSSKLFHLQYFEWNKRMYDKLLFFPTICLITINKSSIESS